ncbi:MULTISPECIES: hypothetical protein [unclassified Yoonia]|nr:MULTISPECIES: hypothetical protein [unclassified Yoonia]
MASSQPNTQSQPTQMGQSKPTAQPAQMQAQVPAKPIFTDLASI